MLQGQEHRIVVSTRREASKRILRLVPTYLLGGAIGTGIILLVGVLIVWLVNPLHLLGNLVQRLLDILVLPIHVPILLLVIFLVWLLASGATFFIVRPLVVLAYIKAVHQAQEEANRLRMPLQMTGRRGGAAELVEQQATLLEMVAQESGNRIVLGEPGAGKTLALQGYQYQLSQRPWRKVLSGQRLPIYLPLKDYSLYIKKFVFGNDEEVGEQEALPVSLLDFLAESDQPGLGSLSPYWSRFLRQGRLLLLCDGLNEVDERYQGRVSEELAGLMRGTQNQVVLTCREAEYRRQESLVQLEENGQLEVILLYPLEPEQVHQGVERYVELQDRHWQHTAGQILQAIERSRLRYHCANPMLLFLFLSMIDKIGVERGKRIDTRGGLLKAYVQQVIEREQKEEQWQGNAPEEREVIRFLSELACAGCWAHDHSAVLLRLSESGPKAAEGEVSGLNYAELADGLRYWLDEHPAQGPFETEGLAEAPFEPFDNLAQLIQFAVSAKLITISAGGILSFRHELIAEYFVAEYFASAGKQKRTTPLPVHPSLLEDIGTWSEPIAFWAGLVEEPELLGDQFGRIALSNASYTPQALALGLLCIGVAWELPGEEGSGKSVALTEHMAEALTAIMRSKTACAELAQCITRCAEEGGEEIYQALFPAVMVEGIDELLAFLDAQLVAELLFGYLEDIVDNAAYEAQVKRLTRVLGRFGHAMVERASVLALPAPERSLRLRAAAINILGGTSDVEAVEPLLARLSDAEMVIVERATNGLIRLGPDLALARVLQVLAAQDAGSLQLRTHCAALTILGRYVEEPDGVRHISLAQYQSMLESLVTVLGSGYQGEPEAQQLSREILVRQGRNSGESEEREQRLQRLIELLVQQLLKQNESGARNISLVLQEIGAAATPALLELVEHSNEATQLHIIQILKVVRDTRALPELWRLMENAVPLVQQRVAETLQVYAPESIPGLLHLVLQTPDELVAERAAGVLIEIGEPALEPILAALHQIVPGRTRLLVQVVAQSHQVGALPALILLLEKADLEPLLAIAVVRALSQFTDTRVVIPLLHVLSTSNPQLYEEAIDALSHLGEIALQKLLAALDKAEETVATARIRRAILGMTPFPGEQLIRAWGNSSEQQAWQIKEILKARGSEGAQVLVKHVQDVNERVKRETLQALDEMPEGVVVPALLECLVLPTQRRVVSNLLLKYPDAAIVPLVALLGEAERGDIVAALLPQFGIDILRPLLTALEDSRPGARERGQRIIISLVRQSQEQEESLRALLHLFHPQPSPRAREVLYDVLSNELADISLPILLEGMDDAYLIDAVAEVLVRLARRPIVHESVVEALLQALYKEEQRRGAAAALIKIGASVVVQVGELITDRDRAVAKIAREILREIGVPSLSFIWSAHSDTQNLERREAALEIFHKMRTETIKDELISLLVSERPENIAMAVTLLLERIHDEAIQNYADHVMIPELVEYVQTHGVEETNLRVIALLLMLGEHTIVNHLLRTLDEYSQHRRQLVYAFLLLGREAEDALQEMFLDQNTSIELRADLAGILGILAAPESVVEYAQNMSSYGLAPRRSGALYPEHLTIALRALGGLLAGGHWDARTLQELRASSSVGSAEHELYSILLGWRFGPQLGQLQKELEEEKEARKSEVVKLSAKIIADQKRMRTLEDELEESQKEHGSRDEEMQKAAADIEVLQEEVEQIAMERDRLRAQLQRAVNDVKYLREQVYQLGGEVPERRSRPSRP